MDPQHLLGPGSRVPVVPERRWGEDCGGDQDQTRGDTQTHQVPNQPTAEKTSHRGLRSSRSTRNQNQVRQEPLSVDFSQEIL